MGPRLGLPLGLKLYFILSTGADSALGFIELRHFDNSVEYIAFDQFVFIRIHLWFLLQDDSHPGGSLAPGQSIRGVTVVLTWCHLFFGLSGVCIHINYVK